MPLSLRRNSPKRPWQRKTMKNLCWPSCSTTTLCRYLAYRFFNACEHGNFRACQIRGAGLTTKRAGSRQNFGVASSGLELSAPFLQGPRSSAARHAFGEYTGRGTQRCAPAHGVAIDSDCRRHHVSSEPIVPLRDVLTYVSVLPACVGVGVGVCVLPAVPQHEKGREISARLHISRQLTTEMHEPAIS